MLPVYKTQLTERVRLTTDVSLFRFVLRSPKEIEFKAGQYLILKINEKSRLYSIASPSYIKDRFELLVRLIPGGVASEYLNNLRSKDEVLFYGPAGSFVLRKNNKNKVFVAAGTGIAPIRSMIYQLRHHVSKEAKNRFFLFWGIKTFDEVFFFQEFKKLSLDYPLFKFYICLSREKDHFQTEKECFLLGHVDEGLKKLPGLNDFEFYLCGKPEMVATIQQYLVNKGVSSGVIFFERF